MCRKFFLLTSFLLVLGLTTGVSNAAGPFLQADDADGIVSMEAEKFTDNVAQGDHTWEMVTATEGFTGLVGMQSLPNSGDNKNDPADYLANSPRLDFQITFVKTGTHYVWVRAWGSGGSDDSCHAGLDGQEVVTGNRISGFSGNYTWTNDSMDGERRTVEITDAGDHTLNIYMREDGAIVDKIVLTTNPDYIPEGDGPADSPGGGTGPVQAFGPVPADGAVEVDTVTLEWVAGYTAVSHKVYLSTDETIDESDFLAEGPLALQFADLAPGTTYYWRVDEVDADGAVHEGEVWSFSTLPIEAHFPDPEDGAEDVSMSAQLSWTAGKGAIMHDVYFGTDEAAVAALDPSTFKGKLMDASFDPGPLEPFTTYYWKVDEFAIIVTNPGPVWSFSTPKYLVISDEETTLDYDNSADPFVTEVAFDTPQDLTVEGLWDLTLRFHGAPGPEGSVSLDEATGTYEITGSGADIWGTSDQFHYVYRELTGDATIEARVVDNGEGSNSWAKGGVMIRQSLDADSINVSGFITGGDGDGGTFQWRSVQGDSSSSNRTLTGIAPPYYVRLVREGNTFTVYMSADGVEWAQQGAPPATIEMTDPVLIGLAVTSHAAGEKRTFTFDNVDIVGNISADDASTDIGIPSNSAEPIYVALEDSTGAVASVTHPDAAATQIDQWSDWRIPLSEFAGVDTTNAAKLYVGVGDGEPGGSGSIRVDDIRVVMMEITDPDLLIYYDFESGAGEMAIDRSGHYNHGLFMGNPEWATGIFGGCVAIDIADLDYIQTEAPLNIVSNTVTVTGWVKHDETPAGWSGILTHRGTDPGCLGLQHNGLEGPEGAELRYMWGADEYWSFSSGLLIPNGEWYFAALAISPEQGKLYLNGVEQTATNVAPHVPTNFDSLIHVGEDHREERIMTSLIDEVRFYNRTLTDVDIQKLLLSDVTAPGDTVKGVPDDGDWPGDHEAPPKVIDNDSGAKYLHFKGASMATGFVVTPLNGPSIVTGLTFTTANDDYGRDPTSFELSGSNESIDGPYTLIASGDIVDFAQDALWPRFTMNATAISFENDVAYDHYQVTFQVSRPNNDGYMQIAEVELLGVPAPAGPVGHWKLDDGAGTIAADSSGNGNDGTLIGDPQWAAGIIGGALDFDGDGDYVDCGYDPLFDITGEITVAAWLNIRSIPTAWTAAVAKGENAWRLSNVNLDPRFHFGITWWENPDLHSVDGATAVGFDEWHHATGTFDGANINVYLDGVLDGSALTTEPLGISTTNLFIGLNPESPGTFWDGLIDEVKVFDRALSEAEISELAAPPAAGPVAHWKLDDGAGTIAVDSSGNGLDGILMGDPQWAAGIIGGALDFDGDGDYVDCGNDASLDITGPISIALWIKPGADDPEGKGTTTAPMAKAMSGMSPDWSYQVRYGWGGPQPYMAFTFNTSPRAWAFVGRNLERYEWCHIACSHDGTTLKCYLNGDETDSTPMGAITSSETPVLIGSDGWNCDWIGAIDDVRIYDHTLSEAEILELAGI